MAKAVSVDNTGRQMSCSICRQTFQEVIVSSCFHTFCTNCLNGSIRDSGRSRNYECPICKTSIAVPSSFKDTDDREGTNNTLFGDKYRADIRNEDCDICEDGKAAVNQCLQCEENLCETCTKAHLKMKASRNHSRQVVSIKDGGQRSRSENRDISDIYCPRHKYEKIIVVCKQCDIFLCLICKLLEHENHVTKLVSEEANDIRKNLSSLLTKQSGYPENLKQQMKEMNNKKSQLSSDLEKELTKVRQTAAEKHRKIATEKSKDEKDLIQQYNGTIQGNGESYGSVQDQYDEYITTSKTAQQLVDTDDDIVVVKKGGNVYNRLERHGNGYANKQLSPKQGSFNKNTPKQYNNNDRAESTSPDEVDLPTSREATESRIRPNKGHTAVKLLTIFHLPSTDGLGYIVGIAPITDQHAWVAMLDQDYVSLVDKDGRVVNKVHVGDPCEGISSDGLGGCFVTCPGEKSIKRVKDNGEVETIVAELLMDPHGISTLRYLDTELNEMIEELYVCLTETRGLKSSILAPQKGCVRAYSFTGTDLEKSFPLRAPVRIDTYIEPHLFCVSDHTNGCVMVSDNTGHVKALYTGHGDSSVFKPLGVCFDQKGYVLIADWKVGKISRITPEGSWVQDLVQVVDDIAGPQSVAIGDNDLMWVGGKNGSVHVYQMYY